MANLLATLRVFPWRRVARLRWLLAAAVLVGATGVGGLLALRVLRPAATAALLPGQALAAAIAGTIARGPGVQLATGAYLPGDRLVLYTRLDETELSRIRSWAVVQLEPFAERLAAMPAGEQLTWVIDYGPAPAEQEVLLAPLRRASDPATYSYVSAAPAMLAQPALAPTAAPAPPLAVPAPVPTAAPVAQVSAPPAPAAGPESSPAVPASPPAVATPLLSADFDAAGSETPLWRPLAGDWAVAGGVYTQREVEGYDFLSLLDLPPQAHYSAETRLRLVEGTMGGGIIYNVPGLTSRGGAQLVDLDQSGAYLRWGHYEADGTYRFDGGAVLDPPLADGGWHTLRVVTHGETSTVYVDGSEIAQIANLSAAGHVGLSTSQARVDFDDVTVLALPEGAALDPPASDTAPAETAERLDDDFDDGDAKGWQVLSGTWQNIDGAYVQTSAGGTDLSSVSQFRGASFTATVRLQLVGGEMGAGLIFNMAGRDTRARSQIVNYTQGGRALQWGHFDDGGNFVFEGSVEVPDGGDGDWHLLELAVAEGRASVLLDGEEVAADVELTYTSGYLGLLVSNGSVAFDDVQIVAE